MVVLVGGAGGAIGGHLVGRLLADGHEVRAVDAKSREDWFQWHPDATNQDKIDLASLEACRSAVKNADLVFNLAADMGGMGFIETHKAECMLSILISTHMLVAAKDEGVGRFFYASSACVYPAYRQLQVDNPALKESDAYPADCEDGYGWEKLFTERMCQHFTEDFGLETRVARYHNVYGPYGTWDGGREKAPAAICRKIALAKLTGKHEIDIWGDGNQTRSFMFVNDCVEGTLRLTDSGVGFPLNLGSDRLVTVNELVSLIEAIAGITVKRTYDLSAPQGVRGRNSDNTLIRQELGWEPKITLEQGLEETYAWIEQCVRQDYNL